LKDIFYHIKKNIKEKEKEEEVDVNIEISFKILKNVLDDTRKRKIENSIDYYNYKAHVLVYNGHRNEAETTFGKDLGDVEEDRKDKFEEYCNWTLQQIKSDRWRDTLQTANQFALDQFLELNSIL